MKKSSIFAALSTAALACASLLFPCPAGAQAGPAIAVKQLSAKPVWLKAEVVHFDRHSIVVRDASNGLKILTFTYDANAQPDVEKALDKGGYQYGDTVKVKYMPGQSVALAIHGKFSKVKTPSKPKQPTPPLHPAPTSKPQ
ncbi:MAG TPA: hypothetical protein VJR26_00645 [Candidatus Acidoferrales bacterium]|nr:hypothetical protein [Candidatus Acidoferrales bacterium]